MDKDEMTKSYMDLMVDHKEKTDTHCEKACEATKEAANTISLSKTRMEKLLRKFKSV